MRFPAKKWGLQGMLFLFLLGGVLPLRAQDYATLDVCNKGTVGVDVVVASEDDDPLLGYSLDVSGWVHLRPGDRKRVLRISGPSGRSKESTNPAYLGFGFFDSHGEFTPASIDRVPDFGYWYYNWAQALANRVDRGLVLTKSSKRLCVHQDAMSYKVRSKSEINCASFHPSGNDGAPFFPLAAALRFQPVASWTNHPVGGGVEVLGGDYYLDVAPTPKDTELHASSGAASAKDNKDTSSADALKLLKQIIDAMPTPEQRRAQEEAEYARQLKADQEKHDAMRKSLADFDPQWLWKPLIVKGTVSRVQVNMPWAIVYFNESPSGVFVVCFQASMFGDFAGKNYSGLIGKTVEVRGQVIQPRCAPRGAGMEISVPAQIMVQ
ncbi:MAG TPA: hypothetical protein VJO16_09740 [Candidatus Acidoferrum sp.]|nr:hypothetical protein [Candidatus Acidoferrum sp.]